MSDEPRKPQGDTNEPASDAASTPPSGEAISNAASEGASKDIAAQMANDALDAVQSAINDASADPAPADAAPEETGSPQSFNLPSFDGEDDADHTSHSIELLSDVDLHVKIELGRTRMLVEDVLRLGAGSVVELDKLAGDPVDVFVNERLVARGEVLVLNDNFCIRVNEVVDAKPTVQPPKPSSDETTMPSDHTKNGQAA